MNKKALVIGIDSYKTQANNLSSCVKDSDEFSRILIDTYKFESSNIIKLQNEEATLVKIQEKLKWLFQDAKENDLLVFYYSGHGYQTKENDVLKECLVPHDEKLFFDDELSRLTESLPPGILSLVLDSCFSGGMEKDFSKSDERIKSWSPSQEGLSKSAEEADINVGYKPFCQSVVRSNSSSTDADNGKQADKQKQVNGLLISACQADEKAISSTPKTDGLSAFTFGLIESIKDLGTNISNKALINEVQEKVQKNLGLEQTPLLIEPSVPPGLSNSAFITLELITQSTEEPITQSTEEPMAILEIL